MNTSSFDQQAWLSRIGYSGALEPTLSTLHQLIFAHSHAVAYESLDIMLGRTPKLDVGALQRKMILGGRGGYCLEQNMLFREGLRSLGYKITSLQGRVVRGMARLRNEFGLSMTDEEIRTCLDVMERKGAKGAPHLFFA